MSTHINIENYESFYLDFLEGNLNENDSAALMAFLEAHPDLMVDEDALAYLPEAEFVALDNQSKMGLKFPDTDQKIGLNNIEIFLIASVEQQLTDAKSKELQVFLKANPSYMDELSLYQRSRLQADLSIVFPEKKSMKKGGIIIPMYARFAAAAASVVIAISVFNFGGSDNPAHFASNGKTPKHDTIVKSTDSKTQKDAEGNEVKTNPGEVVHVIEAVSGTQHVGSEPANIAQTNPAENVIKVAAEKEKPLKYKKAKPVNTRRPVLIEPELAHVPFAAQKESVQDENSFAMVEMKNPIQPITKRISKVIKQDVDFKTTKAARKKSGGFYLKIGKFEVSRKVYDNSSVAVK